LIEKVCLFSKLMEGSDIAQIAKSQPLVYEKLIHFLSNGDVSANGAINWQNIALQLIDKNFLLSTELSNVKGQLDFILRAIKHCPEEAKIHPSIRSTQNIPLDEVKFYSLGRSWFDKFIDDFENGPSGEDNYKTLIEFIEDTD